MLTENTHFRWLGREVSAPAFAGGDATTYYLRRRTGSEILVYFQVPGHHLSVQYVYSLVWSHEQPRYLLCARTEGVLIIDVFGIWTCSTRTCVLLTDASGSTLFL